MKLEEHDELQILTYMIYERFHSNAALCSELGLMLELEYSLDDFLILLLSPKYNEMHITEF
jgi:hypothetical protein